LGKLHPAAQVFGFKPSAKFLRQLLAHAQAAAGNQLAQFGVQTVGRFADRQVHDFTSQVCCTSQLERMLFFMRPDAFPSKLQAPAA